MASKRQRDVHALSVSDDPVPPPAKSPNLGTDSSRRSFLPAPRVFVRPTSNQDENDKWINKGDATLSLDKQQQHVLMEDSVVVNASKKASGLPRRPSSRIAKPSKRPAVEPSNDAKETETTEQDQVHQTSTTAFAALVHKTMASLAKVDETTQARKPQCGKNDLKGKCQEQTAYIAELRALLRALQEEGKTLVQEAEKADQSLAFQLDKTKEELRRCKENELQQSSVVSDYKSQIQDLKKSLEAAMKDKETFQAQAQEASTQLQQELAAKVTLSTEKSQVAGQLEQQRIENDLKWSAAQAEKEQLIAKAEALKEELTQVRAEASRKDQDNAGTVKSMRDMQAFAMSTNERLTAENKALAEKLASIEASSRALEKESSESTSTIQRLQATIEALEAAKSDAIALAKEKAEACLAATTEAQEQLRIAYAETEKRGLLDAQLREVRTELQACMAQLQATKAELKRQADEHKMGLERDANDRTNLEQTHRSALQAIMADMDRLREEKVTLESELNTWKTKWHETQENKNMVEMAALCKAQSEAEVYKMRLNEAQNFNSQSLEAKNQLIAELSLKVKEGEALRRKMHNQIQELRGNVRVFARARPFLPSDGTNLESSLVCDTENQSLTIKVPQRDPEQYTFDRVFAPIAGQDTVFEEVSEFVQSAVDGYQVCLFSYGQTGSGKTHTMQGSGNGEMRGIIPRSIEKVLEECERKNEHGWKYTLQASYLEIYNETVRDLLAPRSPTEDPKSLEISMNKVKGKGVHVPGLKMVPISMIEDVERLVERASRTRSVSATDMNEHSSRSHSVFTLYLSGVNPELHVALEGRLNLVDLAGSERISRSGATGDRLKEAQAINKSLSCLTDVFRAIAAQKTEKNVHIPFRNSKLTYLLQSCLSGDGKTLMMVNLSPTLESANETLCSLRFARDVNKCELGRAKKHLSSTT